MITIENLTVQFGGLVALDAVSVQLEGDVVGIIGPNGAGKTTFLNVFSGFVTPRRGRILAFGDDLLPMPPHRRAQWGLRRSFQKEQVVDELTVADNVAVVLDPLRISSGEKARMIDAALAFTGISELRDVPTSALNAMQRRMTELARCVAGRPKLVMLDEPGAGFSQSEVEHLRNVICGISKFCGAVTLLIDHDVDLIRATCGNTMVLDFGRLVACAPTAEVLADDRVRRVYLGEEVAA
jgi:branched-chain amino acid transport system ATP-binding protein